MPGTAATSIKIAGVQHEFSTCLLYTSRTRKGPKKTIANKKKQGGKIEYG